VKRFIGAEAACRIGVDVKFYEVLCVDILTSSVGYIRDSTAATNARTVRAVPKCLPASNPDIFYMASA